MIRTYTFCDASITSTLAFPELPSEVDGIASGSRVDAPVVAFEPLSESPDEGEWRLRWEFPDKSAMVYRNEIEGPYLYRFDSVHGPRFFISNDGNRVEFETGFGDIDTVRHLLIDQVLPRIRSRQGALMMHAACIETPAGAVAIFGESGQGKSTLSYALQEAGCSVLSDDCAKFELRAGVGGSHVFATSTYPSLRLWPDVLNALAINEKGSIPVAGYNTKRRIDVTRTLKSDQEFRPVQVALGIVLGGRNEEGPKFEAMPKGQAMLEMIKQTFHLDVRDRDIQQRSFQQIDELIRALPTFHLAYPAGLESMSAVARFVIERVQTHANSQRT